MIAILFATALALSAVAAYYSIMGLVAIFSAAVIPIVTMGSLLEVSKLVVASWLYRNWKQVPVLMKTYFTSALLILMLLTSMGIFGYLSKAHLDQAVPSGDIQSKLTLIDEKIKLEQENINAARKTIAQLDAQIDKFTDLGAVSKGVATRRSQQAERARILDDIGQAQNQIAKLREERQPIASEVRKVEAEVGPIKYIAALIYGDNIDETLLEKAVRIVIILIVFVFDPLAVLMLVAANWSLKQKQTPVEPVTVKEPPEVDLSTFSGDHQKSISEGVVTKDEIDIHLTIDEPIKEEELEFKIDKDWEPELYTKHEKEMGRYEADLAERQRKGRVRAFLNKVKGEIERDVDNLQKK